MVEHQHTRESTIVKIPKMHIDPPCVHSTINHLRMAEYSETQKRNFSLRALPQTLLELRHTNPVQAPPETLLRTCLRHRSLLSFVNLLQA